MPTTEAPPREQVVKTFGAEAADFIEQAAALGWRLWFTNNATSCTLIPYDDNPTKRIHLSSRNKNRGALRKYVKTLVKHADPAMAAVFSELSKGDSLPQEARLALFNAHGAEMINSGQALAEVPAEPEAPVRTQRRTAKAVTTVRTAKTTPPRDNGPRKTTMQSAMEAAQSKQHAPATEQDEGLRILTERPILTHHTLAGGGGIGRSYPSQTTSLRTYSDGSTEYVCQCCGKTSQNRRAFGGAHWGSHVRAGEAEKVQKPTAADLVEDPNYVEPAWKKSASDRRFTRLADMLASLDLSSISPKELAGRILEFLGHNSTPGVTETEPVTDSQILDRIRALIDRGTYAKQEEEIKSLNVQVEELMTYAEQREAALVEEVKAANKRADESQSTMTAFLELVNQIKPPVTTES